MRELSAIRKVTWPPQTRSAFVVTYLTPAAMSFAPWFPPQAFVESRDRGTIVFTLANIVLQSRGHRELGDRWNNEGKGRSDAGLH
jgi:hypothetical protein